MKIRILIFVVLLAGFFIYLFNLYAFKREKIVLKINSNTSALDTTLMPTLPGISGMQVSGKGVINDTIIFNGHKISPPVFSMGNDVITDYYGDPPVRITYERYKANEVDIQIEYIFYK